jgi:hypothetical protein
MIEEIEREVVVMRLHAVEETACDGQETAELWLGVLQRIDAHDAGELKTQLIREYAREITGIKLCAFCWRPIEHLLRLVLVPPRIQ